MKNDHKYYKIFFLLSVITLLINDFFLKEHFHNYLTGKLSDFAGLFALPYFLSLFFPKKTKFIYILTCIFFCFWKSDFFEPIIVFANGIDIGINRIVDYSDLIALSILPISYNYFHYEKQIIRPLSSKLKPLIVLTCCFAFIATSMPREEGKINQKANLKVTIKTSKEKVINVLNLQPKNNSDKFNGEIYLEYYNSEITTLFILQELENGLIEIKLDSILYFTTRGTLFKSPDNDSKYIKNLKPEDFEKLYLEKEFIKLYQK